MNDEKNLGADAAAVDTARSAEAAAAASHAEPEIIVASAEKRAEMRERYTPARLAMCRTLWDACREVARGLDCDGRGVSEDNCITDGAEIHDWCPKCLLGEASVQIEWLLSRIGSGNQSTNATAGTVTAQERSAK